MTERRDSMKEALTGLIKVKTIVTLLMTVVFSVLCFMGEIDSDKFLTIFTVIISFYFGTQYEKANGDDVK